MDAEQVVKAMEEAGVEATVEHGGFSVSGNDLSLVTATATADAWSRFRGVPLDEVENTQDTILDDLRGLVADGSWTASEYSKATHAIYLVVERLRQQIEGGDSPRQSSATTADVEGQSSSEA